MNEEPFGFADEAARTNEHTDKVADGLDGMDGGPTGKAGKDLIVEDWIGSATADEIYDLLTAYINDYEG